MCLAQLAQPEPPARKDQPALRDLPVQHQPFQAQLAQLDLKAQLAQA